MFDWDEYNLDHIVRHGVDPGEAEDAVLDPVRVPFPARSRRIGFIGMTEAGRVLVVILDRKRDLWRVVTAETRAQTRRSRIGGDSDERQEDPR